MRGARGWKRLGIVVLALALAAALSACDYEKGEGVPTNNGNNTEKGGARNNWWLYSGQPLNLVGSFSGANDPVDWWTIATNDSTKRQFKVTVTVLPGTPPITVPGVWFRFNGSGWTSIPSTLDCSNSTKVCSISTAREFNKDNRFDLEVDNPNGANVAYMVSVAPA